MTSTHLYFKIKPRSPMMKLIDERKAELAAHNKALRKLRRQWKIPKSHAWMGDESGTCGLSRPVYEAPGWRWHRRHCFNVPNRSTPEGKAIAKALRELPKVREGRVFSQAVFNHGMVMGTEDGRMFICWASFGWSPRGVVCSMRPAVKRSAKTWPDGLVEITGSECERIEGKPSRA